MSQPGTTNLERQIRSQADELERVLTSPTVREQAHVISEGLHRAHRIWVVGTGTSLHAAELGAAMLQEAGRTAHAVPSMQFVTWAPVIGPHDAVIVITHTAETSYALAARAQAFGAGLDTIMITRRGAGFPRSIETVDKETAETYTVSYTTSLAVLALLAQEVGAESITDDNLALVPTSVQNAIDAPDIEAIPLPPRLLVLAGAGPASVTAREGALKVREGARQLAEGYDVEYLLHGSAVPLTPEDHVVVLGPPDDDGFVAAVGRASAAEGVAATSLVEPAPLPALLAQIPLTVRLQLLALRFAQARGQDPDRVIVGSWADEALWRIGAPQV